MPEREIMTLEEVATYLRVSERTVSDLAQKGQIPAARFGDAWRFTRSEIEQWLITDLARQVREARGMAFGLREVLAPERVVFLDATTKTEALTTLAAALATAPQIRDLEELTREILRRETVASTAIGLGIAVPHVRLPSARDLVMAVGISRLGIADYASPDGQPVRIICMLVASTDQQEKCLRMLATVGDRLKNEELRASVLAAPDAHAAFQALTR